MFSYREFQGPSFFDFLVEASDQGRSPTGRGLSKATVPVVITIVRSGMPLPVFRATEFTFNVREDVQPGACENSQY